MFSTTCAIFSPLFNQLEIHYQHPKVDLTPFTATQILFKGAFEIKQLCKKRFFGWEQDWKTAALIKALVIGGALCLFNGMMGYEERVWIHHYSIALIGYNLNCIAFNYLPEEHIEVASLCVSCMMSLAWKRDIRNTYPEVLQTSWHCFLYPYYIEGVAVASMCTTTALGMDQKGKAIRFLFKSAVSGIALYYFAPYLANLLGKYDPRLLSVWEWKVLDVGMRIICMNLDDLFSK